MMWGSLRSFADQRFPVLDAVGRVFSRTSTCARSAEQVLLQLVGKPLFTASAITSAMTPAATPSTEITVTMETTASLRLARR